MELNWKNQAFKVIGDVCLGGENRRLQLFRNTRLIPELEKNHVIAIELDDTAGYGSSFLEEAFGGLVRASIPHERIKNNIFFNSEDESLVEEINEYIDDAILEAKNGDAK